MRIEIVLALGVVGPAIAGPTHAPAHKTKPVGAVDISLVRRQLSANYAAVTTALQRRDIAAVSRLLSDDYRAIAPNGTSVSRDHVLSDFSRDMRSLTSISWPRTITSLKVSGTTALAIVDGHLSARTVERHSHRVDLVATTRDAWVKTSGGWRLKASRLLSSKMLLDGKAPGSGTHVTKPSRNRR